MSEQKRNTTKNQICLGLLAHVDAGKTTLSEAMLYEAGSSAVLGASIIRRVSRYRRAGARARHHHFLKAGRFTARTYRVTLLDTPVTSIFQRMERTLQVLDYAVLVISGTDGVQSHTRTLWRLLERYNVPTFLSSTKWISTAQTTIKS